MDFSETSENWNREHYIHSEREKDTPSGEPPCMCRNLEVRKSGACLLSFEGLDDLLGRGKRKERRLRQSLYARL